MLIIRSQSYIGASPQHYSLLDQAKIAVQIPQEFRAQRTHFGVVGVRELHTDGPALIEFCSVCVWVGGKGCVSVQGKGMCKGEREC